MGDRGHHRELVETQLRAGPVPLHPPSHHQAQGAPEAVPGPAPREGLLRCAEELQAGGGSPVRVVRQRPGLRAHYLQHASGSREVQLHLHVEFCHLLCEGKSVKMSMICLLVLFCVPILFDK